MRPSSTARRFSQPTSPASSTLQPDVEGDATTARCAGWTASAGPTESADGSVTIDVDGDGHSIDGLRAVLTLAWAARDAGANAVDAAGALRRLDF